MVSCYGQLVPALCPSDCREHNFVSPLNPYCTGRSEEGNRARKRTRRHVTFVDTTLNLVETVFLKKKLKSFRTIGYSVLVIWKRCSKARRHEKFRAQGGRSLLLAPFIFPLFKYRWTFQNKNRTLCLGSWYCKISNRGRYFFFFLLFTTKDKRRRFDFRCGL